MNLIMTSWVVLEIAGRVCTYEATLEWQRSSNKQTWLSYLY